MLPSIINTSVVVKLVLSAIFRVEDNYLGVPRVLLSIQLIIASAVANDFVQWKQ